MRATNKIESMADKKTVDTVELQTMLSSGRKTAVEIGTAAASTWNRNCARHSRRRFVLTNAETGK